jgi:hypothetical protein
MPDPVFDRSRLRLQPLSQRRHDLDLSQILPLTASVGEFGPSLAAIGQRIAAARRRGAAVIALMGAHVLRRGVSRFLIDFLQRRWFTHLAMNGAGPIHDWELALLGATTESVAYYLSTGEFGLWEETGRINDVIAAGARSGLGLGEAIGRAILDGDFPYKEFSVLAAAVACRTPVTVHVAIGQDIIHQHPNCDGAALGQTSYHDFLCFARSVEELEGGVVLNLGSAVMGPEVFMKALAMARNVAHQQGREIRRFTAAVFDLLPLTGDHRREADRDDPRYYFRPWKTLLARAVADGGESFYICGDHRQTVPQLHRATALACES